MSFLLEFILQIVMEMIGAMFEGTVKILRLDWRKRKLSKKGLINVGYMVCHHCCTDCVYSHS